MSERSLLEELAASITEQVQLVVKSLEPSQLPHLHEAKPSSLLDDFYPPQPAFNAFQKIITDAQTLVSLLQPSKIQLLNIALSGAENQALRVAVEWGIADAIEDAGGSIELSKLSKLYKTDEHKLGCILRLLTNRHIFVESASGVFSNNRHSYAMVKKPQAKEFLRFSMTANQRAANGLLASLEDPKTAFSFKPEDAPFVFAFDTKKDFFGWLIEPENSQALHDVGSGVNWLNSTTVNSLIHEYPWTKLGENATVIDVGCGPGTTAMNIVKVHNKLNWVMLDLPEMVPGIKELWQNEWPAVLESGQVRIEAHDYFTPMPFRGDLYFLRGVIREYDDNEAVKVLSLLATALRENPKARVILNEIVIPTSIVDQARYNTAPSNYISDRQSNYAPMAHLMTMNCWTMFGGKERTYEEMNSVITRAGLKIENFYKFSIFTAMMECCLADN